MPRRQWQPKIDPATDSQSREPLESNADRFPFLLLNPLAVAWRFVVARLALVVRGYKDAGGRFKFAYRAGGDRYRYEVMKDEPVHYYRLNELSGTTAVDELGTLNGVYGGDETLGVPLDLPADTGIVLDSGLNQDADFAAVWTAVVDNWTLKARIRPDASSQLALAVYNGTDAAGYGFGQGDGVGNAGSKLVGLFGNVAWIDSGYTFPAFGGREYEVAMVRDAGTVRFYVDGVEVGTATPSAPGTPISAARIGSENGIRYFDGAVNEVAVYDHVLTPTRLLAHDAAARVGFSPRARFSIRTDIFRDIPARFVLQVRRYKDAVARYVLQVRSYRDAAARVTVIVRRYKDAAARLVLIARGYKDVAARFFLGVRAYKDVAARFRLAVRGYRDAAARLVITIRGYKDAAARFRLRTDTYKDIATRVVVTARGYKDAGGRFRLAVAKDIATRFRLIGRGYKDAATRARVVGLGGDALYRAEVMADAPVAYWRLADKNGTTTVADSSGNAAHGTTAQGSNFGSAGVLPNPDTAVRATGAQIQTFQVTDRPGLRIQAPISVEFWLRPETFISSNYAYHPIQKTNGIADANYVFYLFLSFAGAEPNPGKVGLYATRGGTWGTITPISTAPLALNRWHHIVGTYDSVDGGRLFIDGVEDGTAIAYAGALTLSLATVLSEVENGTIDEVALYGTTLSPARVAAHYDAGIGHSVLTRFRLTVRQWRDAATRYRLIAPSWKDAAARFRLQVRQWRDAAARVVVTVRGYRDAAARFRLSVRGYKDAVARAVVTVRGYKDAGARFRLAVAKDVATRFRLIVGGYKDAQARFAVTGTIAKDAVARFTLRTYSYKDIGARFRLAVSKDVRARVRVVGRGPDPLRYPNAVLVDDPVAFWRLGEPSGTVAVDSSGNGNDGTYTSGPVVGVNGMVEGSTAARFDGVDDNIVAPIPGGIDATGVSVEAWVYIDSALEKGAFVHIGNGANGYGIGVGQAAAPIFENFGKRLGILYEGVRWINTATDLNVGRHHVVLVIDASGDPTVYLDAVNVYSDSGLGDPIVPTGNVRIGGYTQAGPNRHFAGVLDEVALYDQALTPQQVAAHYDAAVAQSARARFTLTVRRWADAAARFSLRATAWRDAPARFRLEVRRYKDAAARLVINVRSYRDAPARVRLVGQSWGPRRRNYASTVLADTPYAYWRLGDSTPAGPLLDSSGNGRDGTHDNQGTLGVPGAVYDGNTAMLGARLRATGILTGHTGAYSFEHLFKVEAGAGQNSFHFDDAGGFPKFSSVYGDYMHMELGADNRKRWSRDLRDGLIHHIVWVVKGSAQADIATAEVWVDGVLQSVIDTVSTGAPTVPTGDVAFPYFASVNTYSDEFAVYDYALSSAQIRAHAAAVDDVGARTRFRLTVRNWRDAAARYVLTARVYRDSGVRFRLLGQTHTDARARAYVVVRNYKDAGGRFHLATVDRYKDVGGRFILVLPPAYMRDAHSTTTMVGETEGQMTSSGKMVGGTAGRTMSSAKMRR